MIQFCYARNVDGVLCDGLFGHPGKHYILVGDEPVRVYEWEDDGRELAGV